MHCTLLHLLAWRVIEPFLAAMVAGHACSIGRRSNISMKGRVGWNLCLATLVCAIRQAKHVVLLCSVLARAHKAMHHSSENAFCLCGMAHLCHSQARITESGQLWSHSSPHCLAQLPELFAANQSFAHHGFCRDSQAHHSGAKEGCTGRRSCGAGGISGL